MKRSTKSESVLEAFARAVGASAGRAVHAGSDVAEEIMQAAKRIRERISQGTDRVKTASTGTKKPAGVRRSSKATAKTAPRRKRTAKPAAKK